jgi:Mrp family chromosome partitioning ATPase
VPKGYSALAERLLLRANKEPLRTLVFAGCSGGEGSTSVVLEFAETLAGTGMNVLLVDADLRTSGSPPASRPTAPTSSRWWQAAGDARRIRVGSGQAHDRPQPAGDAPDKDRFFRSASFAEWLDAQRSTHDYVLLDAPPSCTSPTARCSRGSPTGRHRRALRVDRADRPREGPEQLASAGANVVASSSTAPRNRSAVPPVVLSME